MADKLWLIETYVDLDQNAVYGTTDAFETFTADAGELFRQLRSQYGQPRNMFLETTSGTRKVGWVFTSRPYYTDCSDRYQREVWAEVFTRDANGVLHPYPFARKG